MLFASNISSNPSSSKLSPFLYQTALLAQIPGEQQPLSQRDSILLAQDSSLLSLNIVDQEPLRNATQEYEVQPGDTITSIASQFGLKETTILWANDISSRAVLKRGAKLRILPADGVLHKVQKGETVGELSSLYQVYTEDIIGVNNLSDDALINVGDLLVIPGAKPLPSSRPKRYQVPQLSDFKDGFAFPAPGAHLSQRLHFNNAVDLAHACGSPVIAAAIGRVIQVKVSGWNGGFGKYIMLAHTGGIVTVYGHLQAVFVSMDEEVSRQTQIGLLGSTGHATGCHVHFEVRGARNPFAY